MKAACLQYLDWAVTDKPKLSFAFGKGLFSYSGVLPGVKIFGCSAPFPITPDLCNLFFSVSNTVCC